MCVAAGTLSSISTGLQIAGTVSGMFGAKKQASAQQSAYNYEAQVATNNAQFAEYQAQTIERNAQVAEWQADDAILRGRDAEQKLRFKVSGLKGAQRARLAAGNVDLAEGSALNILTETDMMGEIDAQTIRLDAAREAWGYKQQSRSYVDQAWAARMQGRNYTSEAGFKAATASSINPNRAAFDTLLGGATQVASRWYSPNSAAVVNPSNYQVGTPGYNGTYLEFDP